MKSGDYLVVTAAIGCGLLAPPTALQAQEIDVAASVECFEVLLLDSRKEPALRTHPKCASGVLSAQMYLMPGMYDPTVVAAMLDGLEQVALTSTTEIVRIAAATSIGVAGQYSRSKYYREPTIVVVPWLQRLYMNASTPDVKLIAVTKLGVQAAQEEAAEALAVIAAEPTTSPQPYHVPIPDQALDHLRKMGPAGEAAMLRAVAQEDLSPARRANFERTIEANREFSAKYPDAVYPQKTKGR